MVNFYPLRRLLLPALLLGTLAARAQNVGIGTTTPTQTLDVNGSLRVRGTSGTGTRLLATDAAGNLAPAATSLPAGASAAPTLASTTTGLNNPLVAASGTLAVVLNRGSSSLSLYDVSNPASPTLRGTTTGLTNPVSVTVSGTTAAVISGSSPYTISVFTLGAGAPALAATITPTGAGNPSGGLALAGTTLYAVCDVPFSRGVVYVYDVGNPASPVQRNATAGTSVGLFTPLAVAAAGNLLSVSAAYGATTPANQLSILDVSNPAAPVVVGNVGGTGTGNYTSSARPVAMSPGVVVALQPENNLLTTYDLSTPAAPVVRNTFPTGTTPVAVALNGTLAYVACSGTSTLQVIDISGSTATLRGSAALDATAQSVAVTSAAVLAANTSAANDLQVFNQPTRTVVVYPDGTASSAPTPGAADFIQNQTAATQMGGFKVSGAGTVGGALAVGGNATVSGTTTLTGATTIGGTATVNNFLNVSGAATFSNGASVNGSASVSGVLTVSGAANLNGGAAITGNATVSNNATITGTAAIGGATTIGGAATVGTTLTLGPTTAPGKVLTRTTGTHNMLAVAYGQVYGGNPATSTSTSGNYTVTRTGVGLYTIAFPAASGLNTVSLDGYPVVMSLYGNGTGFVSWSAYATATATTVTNGTLYVTSFDRTGAAADATFTFVVFQP